MIKKILYFFTVFVLCLCIPLSGISAVRAYCICSGETPDNQQARVPDKINEKHACCDEKDQPPPSHSPCPCQNTTCGLIQGSINITPDPFLIESTAFGHGTVLKTEKFTVINLEERPLFGPGLLRPPLFFLQIQNLRC